MVLLMSNSVRRDEFMANYKFRRKVKSKVHGFRHGFYRFYGYFLLLITMSVCSIYYESNIHRVSSISGKSPWLYNAYLNSVVKHLSSFGKMAPALVFHEWPAGPPDMLCFHKKFVYSFLCRSYLRRMVRLLLVDSVECPAQ